MPLNYSKVAGTMLIVGGIQFVIGLIIAEAVFPGYNVSANYISDLGIWNKPSAVIFNPSIMLFGLAVLGSSYFIQKQFKNRAIAVLFALAGAGSLGVGIFPEDTFVVNGLPVMHSISALTAFVVGGIAAIAAYKITKPPFRYISAILGVATITAIALFFATRDYDYLGLGVGGMERMMAYPTLLWIIGFGAYLLGGFVEKQQTAL